MARKKIEEKTEDVKRNIIKTAIKIIVNDGFSGLTMANIASELQVSKPAIYWYFESKDALIIAINHYVKREYLDQIASIQRDPQLSAIEKLERLVSLAETKGAYDLQLCVVTIKLLLEYFTREDEVKAAIRATYQEYTGYVALMIQQGIEQRMFRQDIDSYIMAVFLVGALDGSLQQTILQYGKDRIDENIKQGKNFLIQVFKKILM